MHRKATSVCARACACVVVCIGSCATERGRLRVRFSICTQSYQQAVPFVVFLLGWQLPLIAAVF